MIVPVFRAGKGDPALVPGSYSLEEVIKEGEALVAVGKPLTHEYLIKAVAQQMGSAHEDEGLEPALIQLSGIFLNGVESYIGVLATDAELTLEVGERVLEAAEQRTNFRRPSHRQHYGDVSLVVRLLRRQHLASRTQLFRFYSAVSAVTVIGIATPTGVAFQLLKQQQLVGELLAPHPPSAALNQDVIAVLSYCSRTGQVRTSTAVGPSPAQACPLGWVHAAELSLEEVSQTHKEVVEQRFLLTFERLLPSSDVRELLELPPSGYGLWKHADELQRDDPFPE